MQKHKATVFVVLGILLLMMVGAGTLSAMSYIKNASTANAEESSAKTFENWSDASVFKTVPAMLVEGSSISDTIDAGMGNYVLDVSNTAKNDYLAYLKLLEKEGFKKYVDNGEEGIENSVFNTTYLKDSLAVTVTYMEPIEKTYISVCEDLPLSEHLFYDDSYVADNIEGAKTTLHMPELFDGGNCFIIQLKNGHFIVSDGGAAGELPYLLDYMDALTPGEEKPVVEAWFYTHIHSDHMGVLEGFMDNPEYGNRVYVEGIYFNIPGEDALERDPSCRALATTSQNAQIAMKSSKGTFPPIYRPQTGQKYYFNDIVIEITIAQEQVTPQTYTSDMNASSTVCMVYIEGQKVCLVGDADRGVMRNMMRVYSEEYFTMDMMSTFHHGIDTWDSFTQYCTVGTILYTNVFARNAKASDEVNNRMLSAAKESYAYGDGTKVLTFPYVIGTAESLPMMERIYHTKEAIATKCKYYISNYPEFYNEYMKDFYKYEEWKDEL